MGIDIDKKDNFLHLTCHTQDKKEFKNYYFGPWTRSPEHCLLNSEKYLIKDCSIEPNEFKDVKLALDNSYKQFLPFISKVLNEFHNVKYSEKFWEIILSQWFYFISARFYYFYQQIIKNKAKISTFHFELNENLIILPRLDIFYTERIGEKESDELTSSMIAFILNNGDLNIRYGNSIQDGNSEEFSRVKRKKSNKILKNLYWKILKKKNSNILLYSLNLFDKMEIIFDSFKYKELEYSHTVENIPSKMNIKSRSKIRNNIKKIQETDTFNSLLIKYSLSILPLSVVEDFSVFLHNTTSYKRKKAVVLSVGYVTDEQRYNTALAKEMESAKIICTQVLGYGNADYFPSSYFDFNVADYFISYGWSKTNINTKFLKIPYKYFEKNSVNTKRISDKIIYVMSYYVKYPTYYSSLSTGFNYYFRINKFFNYLYQYDKKLHEKTYLKFHPALVGETSDKKILKTLETKYSEVERSFEIKDAELVVLDYMESGYLKCLLWNIPILLIVDKNMKFRPDLEEYLQKFQKAGVCHVTPEEAVEKLYEIKGDINSFWYSDEIQKLRLDFLENQMYENKDWKDIFYKELVKVSGK